MSDETPTLLRCLQGRACPAEVLERARSATKLTPSSIEQLPSVLDAAAIEAMTPELSRGLAQFSVRHEVAEADLARTVAACRFLIREAAACDLTTESFADDVALVFPEARALAGVLVGRYEPLKQRVRTQLFLAALEEHGAVLADVKWRVDLVATTTHAPRLLLPVAMLTFTYREGGEERRLTLQAPGDVLRKLRDVAELVLK